nr:MAG: carbon-nitrogen hydrolase family protein [Hyphomicrobiales bacterium]
MNAKKLPVACVQLCSGDDVMDNLKTAVFLIREAAARGARFVATPENTCLMAPDGGAKIEKTFPEDKDPTLPVFCALAEELNIDLLIGSLAIKTSATKTANRSYLIGTDGKIITRYDKIHLFDVQLPSGESYRESNTVEAGGESVIGARPWGKIGMSVCYDLRFPHLYRALAKSGADILTVPSAFTETTGRAHWHILLRSRAIENGCFVVAPAQGGAHANGRKTYGHSLIVSPWGEILAEAGVEPGIISAELNLEEIDAVRSRLPALEHDRDYTPPKLRA